MLEHFYLHSHGLIAIPLIILLKKRGILDIADSFTLKQLGGNEGYMHATLRLMQHLSWVEREDDSYRWTEKSKENCFIPNEIIEMLEFDNRNSLSIDWISFIE